MGLAFKAKAKELLELCNQKLQGTNYDRFWIESLVKKMNTIEKLQPFVDFLNSNDSKDEWIQFVNERTMSADE